MTLLDGDTLAGPFVVRREAGGVGRLGEFPIDDLLERVFAFPGRGVDGVHEMHYGRISRSRLDDGQRGKSKLDGSQWLDCGSANGQKRSVTCFPFFFLVYESVWRGYQKGEINIRARGEFDYLTRYIHVKRTELRGPGFNSWHIWVLHLYQSRTQRVASSYLRPSLAEGERTRTEDIGDCSPSLLLRNLMCDHIDCDS